MPNDAALRRLTSLLAMAEGAGIPAKHRPEWHRATEAALGATLTEAATIGDVSEGNRRVSEIYMRYLRAAPTMPARSRLEHGDHEAARVYGESLGIADARERAAFRRSAGMPTALADRMRTLALEGKLQ